MFKKKGSWDFLTTFPLLDVDCWVSGCCLGEGRDNAIASEEWTFGDSGEEGLGHPQRQSWGGVSGLCMAMEGPSGRTRESLSCHCRVEGWMRSLQGLDCDEER